jgi:UDP-N-acetylglucosamine 1-carboxyvinyltransferase
MDTYVIDGGEKLYGKVQAQSAKNAVLPLLAAAILTDEQVRIRGVPVIADVENMLRILVEVGCKISRKTGTYKSTRPTPFPTKSPRG